MRDFIATPFLLLTFVLAWITGFISGRPTIIAQIYEEDEDGSSE